MSHSPGSGRSSSAESPIDDSAVGDLAPEKLVDRYEGLVKRIVNRIHETMRGDVPYEDLLQYGYEGLLDARNRYEADRSAAFSSYAYYRIRGAVYDGCRKEGWTTKRPAKVRQLSSLNDYMEERSRETGTEPSSGSSSQFEESLAEVEDTVTDCVIICLLEQNDFDRYRDAVSASHAEKLERRELYGILDDAIDQLDGIDRAVIERYYLGTESMGNIAEDLGYSKSWISRVNTRAIRKIREYFDAEHTGSLP